MSTVESPTSRTLTLLQLQGQGACSEYLEKFRTVYGDQVEITVVLCVEQAAQWDWDWAAIHLLTAPPRAGDSTLLAPPRPQN